MKKFKILILSAFLITTYSCEDDFLDVEPFGEVAENYFQDADDYNSALIGVYDQLSTTYMSNIIGEIASDNAYAGGDSPSDTPGWQTIDDMIHDPSNDQLLNYWRWMYGGISRANFLIDNQDTIGDFDGRDKIIAEAKFLRAYYYFELAKFFGNIPYSDNFVDLDEVANVEQITQSEAYAKIAADLETTIQDLPWQNGVGRVTKGAALSLLGKVYLYNKNYTEAAATLQKVIDAGQYRLLEDVSSVFSLENENNDESVFEVQYIGTQGGSFDCFACVEGNIVPGYVGPRFRGGDFSPYADGWSFSPFIQELVDAYTTGDIRKESTIFDLDAFIEEQLATTGTEVTYAVGNEHTGYFNQKYMPYAEGNAQATNLTHSNNYRAIRYADVLLMAAEAYSESGNTAKALEYVNQVRERAGLESFTDISNLTEKIWKERRLELAGEGQRFFDQVRTGQTASIPGFVNGKHELFPIPLVEIRLSEGRWQQNPGY